MQHVGRGDVHDIDGGIGHQRLPIACCAGKAEARGGRLGQGGGRIGQKFQPGLQGEVEDAADARQAQRMGAAHEARADEAEAE
jgi:hypothetical protein